MEKPKKPALRRPETMINDVKKLSSSLNISTSSSSLRSSTASTVRFAPTPTTMSSSSSSAASAAAKRRDYALSQQKKQTAARPATARPASVSGPRRRSLHGGGSPELGGPKGLGRSWGWGMSTGGGGGGDVDGRRPGDAGGGGGVVKAQVRSSSVPRRTPTDQVKGQQQKREIKTKNTSKAMSNSGSPPKSDLSMERRSPSSNARKNTEKVPNNVSLNNMVRASPPRKTTPATMGASWESLPSDLQSIGLEVMSYRDAAEVAAVEALQEASSAEILLRCLSAFADLAAAASEQSPQQTVDEFLALQSTLSRFPSSAAASAWLRAAVAADLAPFSLYSSSSAAAVSEETTETSQTTWVGEAAREVGEEAQGWFVCHVERLIDADAAGTLGQLKRVNDWLDEVNAAGGDGERGTAAAVERLRRKIFGYLLDHVESAVVALNGAADRRR
uniref:DUF6857 domain-containing protein n=1 Tax=Leersia perrieri TaxID=77586 RepID=A0A0D9XR26_9ORYZ